MTSNKMNLDAMSAEELVTLINEATAMLESKKEEAKAALVQEMIKRAEALGLSLQEVLSGQPAVGKARKPRSDAGKARDPRYRGPGGLTWSGKGRKPGWLTELEAQGKSKDDFAV
ncbi:H-NS histone family protein [Sabulicella glaciei]|uniref:H-NS histone family protein n=1 Tax=Sabulicella glaciei TaxID=2984948 RepID=A0ABT3NZV4_9PROT|nr:H-NS histone family protein [Roseococcus sp. MDT2-1-1]MCW8087661.1 H-NS histone family protein [Roseococcus sp. MDT2-1-1]